MLWWKGRFMAERYRFFLRSPYHHHLQQLWTYSEQKPEVESVWLLFLQKLGLRSIPEEEKLLNPQDIHSKVIWLMHLKSIWLFVFTIILYFKVR
jgi:hypothetical protein